MATIVTQDPSPAWSGARLTRLKQRSQEVLEQLAQVPAVQGACLCDNHGAVLGLLLSVAGNRRLFERIALGVTQSLVALQARSTFKEMELRFERKLVMARDLGNALIVVVCSTEVNLPVLRMALNVATNPFETDLELQRSLLQVAPSRSNTLRPEHLDPPARQLLQKGGLKVS